MRLLPLKLQAQRIYGSGRETSQRAELGRAVRTRLGITLLQARPYDAPARGKMERFWRRMREEASSHIGQVASLAEVELKLRDWLARYYQA